MVQNMRNAVEVNGYDDWEAAVEEALAICDNDVRATLRTLLIANQYLHSEVERLQTMISRGYGRRPVREGKLKRPSE